MKKIIIAIIALTLLGSTNYSYAEGTPVVSNAGVIIVNGNSELAEIFEIGEVEYLKIRDLSMSLNQTKSRFSYTFANNLLTINSNQFYKPTGDEFLPAKPGHYQATKLSNTITLNNKSCQVETYLINGEICVNATDIARALNIGKGTHIKYYSGSTFSTNHVFSENKGEMLFKVPSERGNSSYNASMQGFAAQSKDFIFFIHRGKVYRMKHDGADMKAIGLSCHGFLNVSDNRLHRYVGYSISSSDFDGKDVQKEKCAVWIGIGQEPRSILYVDNYVYVAWMENYKDGWNDNWSDGIYRYATSGYDRSCLFRLHWGKKKIVNDFYVSDDGFLYFGASWYNRINLREVGKNKVDTRTPMAEEDFSYPQEYNGKHYAKRKKDNKIYQFTAPGKFTPICDLKFSGSYCLHNNMIIYRNMADNVGGIYCADMQGGNVRKLYDKAYRFCVVGDWLVIHLSHTVSVSAAVLVRISTGKTTTLPS